MQIKITQQALGRVIHLNQNNVNMADNKYLLEYLEKIAQKKVDSKFTKCAPEFFVYLKSRNKYNWNRINHSL